MISRLCKRLNTSVRLLNRRFYSNAAPSTSFRNTNRIYTPEEGFYWKSPFEDVELPKNIALDDYVWKDINKWQDRIALECGITGRKYTYAELRDACAKLAIRLQTHFKLEKNDVVGIILPNLPEYAIALLGSIEAGLIVTTVNPEYTIDEIGRHLKMCNVKLIFGLTEESSKLIAIQKTMKNTIQIITLKTMPNQSTPVGVADLFELINEKNINFSQLKNKNTDPINDVCILPCSSGTTGLPKGIMLTHFNKVAACQSMQAKTPDKQLILPTTQNHQDVLLCILPFFHLYGLTINLVSKLSLGCKIVTLPKFQLDEFLASIEKHQVNILHLVPYVIILWGKYENAMEKHVKSVRTIMSAAAPLGASDFLRFQEKGPHVNIIQSYGLSEVSTYISQIPYGSTNFASIGIPLPHAELKIVNTEDSRFIGIEADQVGELLIRGPYLMKGYLNNEEATKNAILPNGWFRSGDLCSYDTDGNFYIKDRLKELIKVKGYQVAPAELEEELRLHPKILDAGIIGIPHPVNGEVPKAFVVKKKNAVISEQEIKDYVAKKLASYKHLKGGVEFIDVIPRTDSGKILRRQLKNRT